MKPVPDCVPDALAAILAAAKAVSDEEFIHRKVLLKVMGDLADDGDLGLHPADIYLRCWETACRLLGVRDPYENEKARADKTALGVMKYLEDQCRSRTDCDPMRLALRLSYAGAMVDFNGLGRQDLQERMLACVDASPAIDHADMLLGALMRADSVVLVANRAGEIVLDRQLLEMLAARGKKVYAAVAAKPVFLMATERDVQSSAYPESVQVVNPGTGMYGLVQERASSAFRDLLSSAGVVIVKGSTHFSTMSPSRDMFFILKADEADVAERLDIPCGSGAIVRMAESGI